MRSFSGRIIEIGKFGIEDLFFEKKGWRLFFSRKRGGEFFRKKGVETFFRKILGGKDIFV